MNLSLFHSADWAGRYSEYQLRTFTELGMSHSPINVLAGEYFRSLAEKSGPLGPSVPVDVFLFSRGDHPSPHVTKIGGTPYRPLSMSWPRDVDGVPMVFLAQICFSGSTDHVNRLPGDVLLIFARVRRVSWTPDAVLSFEDDHSLSFEWYPLGMSDLMTASDVPPVELAPASIGHAARGVRTRPPLFPRCYGVRFRTVDYLDSEQVICRLKDVVPSAVLPTHEFFQRVALYGVSRYSMTKIGGCPIWYTNVPQQLSGRFIAGFAGIVPAAEVPYPWVNEEVPLDLRSSLKPGNDLRVGDPGFVNIFLDDAGKVHWYHNSLH